MTLKPLNLKSKLSPFTQNNIKYSMTIKDSNKKTKVLADPRATRSLLALMNLSAVNGGAACHWGGPSAMTEVWTALHGIMFEKE